MWEMYEERIVSRQLQRIRQAQWLLNLPAGSALPELEGSMASMDAKTLRELWATLTLIQTHLQKEAAGEVLTAPSPEPVRSGNQATDRPLPELDAGATGHEASRAETRRAQLVTCTALCERLKSHLLAPGQTNVDTGVASLPKLQAYSALLKQRGDADVANAGIYQWSPEHVAPYQRICAELERLLAIDPVDYLRQDIQEDIAKNWEAQGDFARRTAQEGNEARLDYEQAIARFDANDQAKLADRCRVKLAQVILSREANVDVAIQQLRSLLHRFPAERQSLEHATVLLQLAQTYATAGDAFETAHCLSEIETELKDLTYPAPVPGQEEQSFQQWLEVANEQNATIHAYEQALTDVVSLYMGIYSLYTGLKQEPEAVNLHAEQAKMVNRFSEELRLRSRDSMQQDAEEVSAFYAEVGKPQGVEDPTAFWNADSYQVLFDLERRLGALEEEYERRTAVGAPLDELLPLARALETEARRWNAATEIGMAQIMQANILLDLQRPSEAIELLRTTLLLPWEEGKQLSMGLWALERMVTAYINLNDNSGVSDACDQAIHLIERYRYQVTAPYLQSAYLNQRVQFYSLGVFSAWRLGDYERMLERAELSKARATLRELSAAPPDPDQQGRAQAEEEPEDAEQQFQQVCRQIEGFSGSAESDEYKALLVKRRTLWDLRWIRRMQANPDLRLPDFRLSTLQAALDSDEAILYYYWLGPTVLLIVAIDRDQILVERQIMTDEERAEMEMFAQFVLSLKQEAYSYLDSVRRFSARLLPETIWSLLANKQRLIFSPHRLLHAFPFHALQWQGEPLIRRFAVSYTPNLSSLLVTYSPTAARSVFALGVRDFAVPGMTLNSLAEAEQEVEAVQSFYSATRIPVETLTGNAATRQALQRWSAEGRGRQYRLLHFATHGADVQGDTPMESHLLLQDGPLDGLEIAEWRLNADLVVLSACHSGQRAIAGRGMNELPGDEIFGLQAAFFMAGARRVVGALWPAASQCAYSLMKEFHRRLADGIAPEVALQRAMIDHLDRANLETKRAYYWAPFVMTMIGRPLQHAPMSKDADEAAH